MLALLLALLPAGVSGADLQAGRDFARIDPARPASQAQGIEVLEWFWYGCPHCYHFEKPLHAWLEKRGGDVRFVRRHFPLGRAEPMARAWVAARGAAKVAAVHERLFTAIHEQDKPRSGEGWLEAVLREAGVLGIRTLEGALQTPSVDQRIGELRELAQAHGVQGVPTLVIDGRYRISPGDHARTLRGMLDKAARLIEAIRAGKAP
jgi:thiol:disulfide interchange protein DsbA